MIENGLGSDEEVLCIKFNGWRFQIRRRQDRADRRHRHRLVEKRPLLTQAGLAVKDIFKRIDWLKIARHGGGLAFTAFTGIPQPIISARWSEPVKDLRRSLKTRHQGKLRQGHRRRGGC